MIRKVLIVGAGGNLGPSIVQAFLSTPSFEVSVLTRDARSKSFAGPVRVFETDYSEESLLKAMAGQDAVVAAVGFRAVGQQKKLIDVAIKAGVQRFIPSEFGGDSANPRSTELRPPVFQIKLDILDYLKEQEKTGLTWSVLVTGPFFDWGLSSGFLGFDLKKREALIWDDGACRFSTTTLSTVGQAVVKTLQHPDETANRFVYVASFTLSLNDILEALEKSSASRWTVVRTSGEDEIEAGQQSLRDGDLASAVPRLVRAGWYTRGRGGNYGDERELDNALLALPRENLDAVVSEVLRPSA
ncbi:hypothetical protein AYO20_02353 [Fonsecaea nubica]|uniref:NmrA-like domain-containing protein n=1 Tax=Fonsecaea nubica TaxID=856822 RepID=A0A178DAF6_9EURO|nr:hypothetical protein AYO20_02353 [Fonsecaea nubica]OAL38294.1 hypothetical protein AYO20_02353 [Fonsecaea nubica]